MSTTQLKLGLVQMTSGPHWQTNLKVAARGIDEAAAQGAQFVILPENFACYSGDYRRLADDHGQDVMNLLAHLAKEHGVWLLAGSLPMARRHDGSVVPAPRVRAASLLFGPSGDLIARYDKLHLFDARLPDAQGTYRESAIFEPGDVPVVVDVSGVPVGMAICYDLRFPAMARYLADQGAQLLVYPSAFTAVTGAAHWALLLRARAVETGCFVVGVNQCGQHGVTRSSYGHSMAVDPWAEVVASMAEEPGICVVTIDVSRITEIRQRLSQHEHQRFQVTFGQGERKA